MTVDTVSRDDLIAAINDLAWRYPGDVPSLADALLMHYRIEGKTLHPETLEEIHPVVAPAVDRGDVVTEHAIGMTDGSKQVRPRDPEIERIYPLAQWIPAHQRFGGKVYRRRIRIVKDWVEVPKGEEAPHA